MALKQRSFVSLDAFCVEDILDLLDLAASHKADEGSYRYARVLQGKVVGLFFEKPSLRTRISFEVAVYQLGGQCLYMGPESGALGGREAVRDQARVVSRYLDALVLRTLRHETILEFAKYCNKPVINGLSDQFHPCQALGDMLTIREKHGRLTGLKLAYIGDANNVCRSLAHACVKCGVQMVVASPQGYELSDSFLKSLSPSDLVTQRCDPVDAVKDADVIYTDVWTSMGQEGEAEKRKQAFQGYQVNAELIEKAPKAIIMHCLPAHRGEEITDQVVDAPRSVVYDQAENRLHVQRALFCRLMG